MSTFEELGLKAETVAHLLTIGYTAPTPVQVKTIPLLLEGSKNVIALAPTGTGKTAAFGLPLIDKIDYTSQTIQGVVMCPTRELAMQVNEQLNKLGAAYGFKSIAIYGGASYDTQRKNIRSRPHVVVATPGRLVDMLDQKALDFSGIQYLILDEADEMLSMGFKDEIDQILEHITASENSKTWLFSATLSSQVKRVVEKFIPDHKKVEISNENQSRLPATITHYFVPVYEERKKEAVIRIIENENDFYGIIFVQRKIEAAMISDVLNEKGLFAESLHGDKSQKEREVILAAFKKKKVKVLVATDVAARGLDIENLTHVINYSLPFEDEVYVHRVGRTGRNGQKGVAYSTVCPKEMRSLEQIKRVLKIDVIESKLPTGANVLSKKIEMLKDKVKFNFEKQNYYTKFSANLTDVGLAELFAEKTPEQIFLLMIQIYQPDWLAFKEIETFEVFDRQGQGGSFAERGSGNRFGGGDRRRSGGGRFGGGDRRGGFSRDRRSDNRSEGGDEGRERFARSNDEGGERPQSSERPAFNREDRPQGDRPSYARTPRAEGDRPSFNRGERSERPSFNRGSREGGGERSPYARAPRAEGDRPAWNRERSDRSSNFAPRGERSEGAARPPRDEWNEKPRSFKDEGGLTSDRRKFTPGGSADGFGKPRFKKEGYEPKKAGAFVPKKDRIRDNYKTRGE